MRNKDARSPSDGVLPVTWSTERRPRAPADGLPTFPAIAAKPDLSADYLRAAMNPQHSRMPDFALSRRQQDDLIAYIYSLRAK